MEAPLCKITYSLALQQQSNTNNNSDLSTNSVSVFPTMTTHQIAQIIGQKLGCGYQEMIEQQIKNELTNILRDGSGCAGHGIGDEEVWRDNMQKVIGIQVSAPYENTPLTSQKRYDSKYFQVNYDKFFKTKSHKILNNSQKQNSSGIYQRSIAKKKKTKQRMLMIKNDKDQKQIIQCTFSPNISNTLQFFNKKNPTFFKSKDNEKQNIKNNTFEKLYKNAFDIRQKKSKRLRTLENEEESKFSELSFVPAINQCSREICRMKSYASFVSQLSEIHEKQEHKLKQKGSHKAASKQNTVKKKKKTEICTFQPQISENTKRMTKNLPGFYERLEKSKQRQERKENKSQKKIHRIVCNARDQNSLNKIVLKKQIYTIEDGQQQEKKVTDELQTQKKQKNTKGEMTIAKKGMLTSDAGRQSDSDCLKEDGDQKNSKQRKIYIEKRSEELLNNRRKNILERIAKYLTIQQPIRIEQFSKIKKAIGEGSEVQIQTIQLNPYIPQFIKEIISPITQQLRETNLSLTKSEFLWALQTLFDGLNLSDRGKLLGWGVKLLPQQKNK